MTYVVQPNPWTGIPHVGTLIDAIQDGLVAAGDVEGSTRVGVLASIGAAATYPGGTFWATDQAVLYVSDGASWYRMSDPAGITTLFFSDTPPTGWVKYDGGTLAGSTGIYADLYAHLGSTTTLPDTRGRMPVGLGTHADVDAIGDSDGEGTVANRRPKHKHTVAQPTITKPDVDITDPGHTHTHNALYSPGGGSVNPGFGFGPPHGAATIDSATTGITAELASTPTASGGTVGPQTGAELTDSPGYITFCFIAKL